MHNYSVSMLRCFGGTFYVGVTNDVDRRFAEQCMGLDEDCYTYTRRPLRLVAVGEFRWIDQAIAFEKQLKRWSHRKKRAFAEERWDDVKRFARSG